MPPNKNKLNKRRQNNDYDKERRGGERHSPEVQEG